MFKVMAQIIQLLNKEQKKKFLLLQFLVVLMAVFEVVGVLAIAPFMAVIGDTSLLSGNGKLASVYKYSGIESELSFIFFLGVFVLVLLAISSVISIITSWRLSRYAIETGTEMSDRLYEYYLKKGWTFHIEHNSSKLIKNITNDTQRVTGEILSPLMNLNARIVLAFFIAASLFYYDPKVAVIGLLIFGVTYFGIYRLIKHRLLKNGSQISQVIETRYKSLSDSFGGIKDLLLHGREDYFLERFKESGKDLTVSVAENTALSQVPRYFVELVAFGSLIFFVLYLINENGQDVSHILPMISVYAFAGYKLMPALQHIYTAVATIRGGIPAFHAIEKDLRNSQRLERGAVNFGEHTLQPKNTLTLDNVSFTYPGSSKEVLHQLSMTFKVNAVIGIVGPSGAGKSTIIDLILGLTDPSIGCLKVDGYEVSRQRGNLRAWQNAIGFVPQSIFLAEGSILENIAFGVDEDDIDIDCVMRAIKLAHLDEFVGKLQHGVFTNVGEQGVQLSGGQRQRIGIARALYNDPAVLVFDEATSALDGITEKMIMDAIHDFSGQKTIIMIAHRLKTVEKCDQIFLVDQGQIVDQGTFEELINNNEIFKNMALHA